ncbi:MAG: UDP-N-acetylglucosamine diphosphorylase [Candidatus Kerfeldbacteria bacterium]|nr:UDP-N-acetylglucosamine diphosphorylase [Candidatus Kerfeldbacteria bacterium]
MSFAPSEFFDLSDYAHASIFDGIDYVWEILPIISEYLDFAVDSSTIQSDVSHAAYIGDRIIIGQHVTIEPGVVIHGPAIIGEGSHVRTGAYIRGNVIIGKNCMIGNSTEIKNSVLLNDVAVPHFNYVGDSVLGNGVHLGASVVLSNLKTPPSEISVTTLHGTHKTGLTKFGAIIGDGVEIGAHAVLNPGTIVGKQSIIYPLALVRGVIAEGTILKVRQQQEIVIKRT